MDMLFTGEQQAIVDSVARFLNTALSRDDLHKADRPGQEFTSLASDSYWNGLAEMGVFALTVPELVNGAGLGLADQTAVFRELGRHLAVGPVLGTVLAAHALGRHGMGGDLLDAIMSGQSRVALACPQPGHALEVGARVTGRLRAHDLDTADLVLVINGPDVAIITATGAQQVSVDAVDPTSPVHIIEVDVDALWQVVDDRVLRDGTVLQASFFCGMAEATRDDSASYVTTREQFGKPIGAFQGVKHRCAEMAVRSEAAFFQTVYAALSIDEGLGHEDLHAASAFLVAREASNSNSADNVQNYGGMGVTAEADPSLFIRRHMSHVHTFGGSRGALETVAHAKAAL